MSFLVARIPANGPVLQQSELTKVVQNALNVKDCLDLRAISTAYVDQRSNGFSLPTSVLVQKNCH